MLKFTLLKFIICFFGFFVRRWCVHHCLFDGRHLVQQMGIGHTERASERDTWTTLLIAVNDLGDR